MECLKIHFILRLTGSAMTEVKRLVYADLKAVRDRITAPPPAPVAVEQQSLFD
jgi:hypothetical protein